MRSLLLAAGYGSRLKLNSPKCLVDINGKPLLQYWFELLFPTMEEVIINTHWLSHDVMNFCADSKWFDRITISDESVLLGTAGTLLSVKHFFQDQPFLVAHADNLSRFDLNKFIESHKNRPKETEITMMTFLTDNPLECGVVSLDENDCIVEKFQEKRGVYCVTDYYKANAAVYIFEPSIFKFLESKPCIDISKDIIPHYLGRINTWHNSDYHRDIGTPESLARARNDFS